MTSKNALKNRIKERNILKKPIGFKEEGLLKARLREEHAEIANLVGTVVAKTLRVPPQDIFSRSRCQKQTALARQMTIYLLHTGVGLSLNKVAPLFKRDRTTAAHACRKIEELRDNRDIDIMISHLERGLEAWQHAFQFREVYP